jgi:DNA-binding NarL/FixJ family response regulator
VRHPGKLDEVHVIVVAARPALAQELRGLAGRSPLVRVVAAVPDGDAAIVGATASRIDVAVVDLDHGSGDGMAAIRRIRDGAPRVRVLAVGNVDSAQAPYALAAGACGLVHAARGPDVVRESILRAVAGELVLPDRELTSLVDRLETGRPQVVARGTASLTARERQVLTLLADGTTTADVARQLGISALTVQSHVKNILAKLGVHSKMEAVRLAWRDGLARIPAGA